METRAGMGRRMVIKSKFLGLFCALFGLAISNYWTLGISKKLMWNTINFLMKKQQIYEFWHFKV
jgi:hypothetical protein